LTDAAARFAHWMDHVALPVWSGAGLEPDEAGFAEHLTLDGRPAHAPFKRVRVQARQLYVYAHAAALGRPGALAAARRGYDFLVAHARLPDGLWARRLGRHGGVQDATVDLYDQSFVVLALAHFHRASGEAGALDLAAATVRAVEAGRHPAKGFHNAWPEPAAARQQNPHMHLLEATLALYEASRDEAHGALADELAALFHDHFFEGGTGTLAEYLDDGLSPLADDHVEPGHHMEWVWLLREHGRLRGANHTEAMAQLYQFAVEHGTDPATGLLYDVVGRDGRVRDAGTRLWPQTEAVRAHLVMARPDRADAALDALTRRFLDPAPDGMWHDHFGPDGTLRSDKIPASSLYHLFTAYAELKANP